MDCGKVDCYYFGMGGGIDEVVDVVLVGGYGFVCGVGDCCGWSEDYVYVVVCFGFVMLVGYWCRRSLVILLVLCIVLGLVYGEIYL